MIVKSYKIKNDPEVVGTQDKASRRSELDVTFGVLFCATATPALWLERVSLESGASRCRAAGNVASESHQAPADPTRKLLCNLCKHGFGSVEMIGGSKGQLGK
jgi:hypothetical protein